MPLPFEQQPRESSRAFAAFKVYLGLGPQRSLAAVGQKLGKSRVVIEGWSSKFDWVSRVRAHGAHLAEVERKAIEAQIIEITFTTPNEASRLVVIAKLRAAAESIVIEVR